MVKRNLIYMAKPIYGGWVSFTAHLSLKKNYNLYKIGNKTEQKKRQYGYSVEYQNMSINDIKKLDNILITAIDKSYYKYLDDLKQLNNVTIVIHDPTELKGDVLDALPYFKIITIRKTVQKYLKEKHNLKSKFLHHPFYAFPIEKNSIKNTNIAISRVDFDKHTDIIVGANDKLPKNKQVQIYGALNDLYVYHKLRDTNFKKYYKGKFGKSFEDLMNLLNNCKFMVDMSAIKNDGGGSQYTFLEAIYFDCILVLNSKWVDNVNTPFSNGVNCYVVKDSPELTKLLKNNSENVNKKIIKNAKLLLEPHLKGRGW